MKQIEKAESLVPFMSSWDTAQLEEAYVSFCVETIESGMKIDSRIYDLVCSIDETWFTYSGNRAAYTAIKKTLAELDGDGFVMPGTIAMRINMMKMAGLCRTSISGEKIIEEARSSSPGFYSYSLVVNSLLPLWRLKLVRRHIRDSAELLVDALDREPTYEVFSETIPALLEKQHSAWVNAAEPNSVEDSWSSTIDELLQPLPKDNSISTGIVSLDNTIQGGIAGPGSAYGGRLIVVAARPGMGKTTIAVTLATQLAKTGHDIAFFSLEMPRKQIEYKSIASLDFLMMKGNGPIVDPIRTMNIQNRSYTVLQRERLTSLRNSPFVKAFSVFDRSQDATSLASTIRLMARTKDNLRAVFIDYLQLIDGCTGTSNDAAAIGVVTKALKRVAVEVGIDIILMSQVNRGVEQRTEKMPTLADLRASGRIEEDADIVIFLFRPGYYDVEADPYELAISVAKNRAGVTGILPCKIDLASSVVFDRL
jgi:replicative DNA helicase